MPPLAALKAMSATAIRASLETGKMREQAAALTAVERDQVAAYLGTTASLAQPVAPLCTGASPKLRGGSWNGWGVDLSNTRMQPDPGFDAASVPRLKLKWAFALGAGVAARSQPTVVDGRLYIGSQSGAVHALDAATGCRHWTFSAAAQIRSGLLVAGPNVYFGDGKANVYAIDSATGKQLWTVRADDHPMALVTGTVQFHKGILYVPVASFEEGVGGSPKYQCCTFRGSVLALDAATGKQLWKSYVIAEKPQLRIGDGRRLVARGDEPL